MSGSSQVRRAIATIGAAVVATGALAGCITVNPPAPEPSGDAVPVTPAEHDAPAEESTSASDAGPAPQDEASTPRSWQDVFADVSAGVLMVGTTTCDDLRFKGTAFLVAPDVAVTAAHVVDGASGVTLSTPDGTRTIDALLVGIDVPGDVAVLQLEEPLSSEDVLTITDEKTAPGMEVATIGYPLDSESPTISSGIVSVLDVHQEYQTIARDDLVQTDTTINPGNSGGPVVTMDGDVVGIASGKMLMRDSDGDGVGDLNVEGTGWFVPTASVRDQVVDWAENGPIDWSSCSDLAPEESSLPVVYTSTDDRGADDVAAVLEAHGRAINESRYGDAFALFSDAMQDRFGDVDTWSDGLHTSIWYSVDVGGVEPTADGLVAQVALQTLQEPADGPDGQECSTWNNTYTFVEVDGELYVDSVALVEDPLPCAVETDW